MFITATLIVGLFDSLKNVIRKIEKKKTGRNQQYSTLKQVKSTSTPNDNTTPFPTLKTRGRPLSGYASIFKFAIFTTCIMNRGSICRSSARVCDNVLPHRYGWALHF